MYRTLGSKTKLLIDFQKLNFDKALENMQLEDEKPLLIYIHKNDHKLSERILKSILQDPEIADMIVSTFSTGNSDLACVVMLALL